MGSERAMGRLLEDRSLPGLGWGWCRPREVNRSGHGVRWHSQNLLIREDEVEDRRSSESGVTPGFD